MYASLLRWQDAAPEERDKLIPMDYDQYDAWSENARLARMEHLKGKLTAEEFLRRIDTTHELDSYETDRAEQIGQTVWQQRVAGDISFDPELRYPETIQCLDFDLGAAEPKWEVYTGGRSAKTGTAGASELAREVWEKSAVNSASKRDGVSIPSTTSLQDFCSAVDSNYDPLKASVFLKKIIAYFKMLAYPLAFG